MPRYPRHMPKTPEQLQAEIDAANADRPEGAEDSSRTAEGLRVPMIPSPHYDAGEGGAR